MGKQTKHNASYDKLAVLAGTRVGMANPTPLSVAANEEAKKMRDELWLEYENLLRDDKTYTLADIIAWSIDEGIKGKGLSKNSIHRARTGLLKEVTHDRIVAHRTVAVLKAAKAADMDDIFAQGNKMAAQLIKDAIASVPAEGMEATSVSDVMRMFETFGRLQKNISSSDLAKARTEALKQSSQKLSDEMKRVQRTVSKTGELTNDMIDEVREAIFGRV